MSLVGPSSYMKISVKTPFSFLAEIASETRAIDSLMIDNGLKDSIEWAKGQKMTAVTTMTSPRMTEVGALE